METNPIRVCELLVGLPEVNPGWIRGDPENLVKATRSGDRP